VTLRTKFFALFTILAVVPLVGVGAFGYVRSMRAVEALVTTQVEQIANSAARQLGERYAVHEANMLLLARNAETQRLFEALAGGDSATIASAQLLAAAYLANVGRALGSGYDWIELRDGEDRVLERVGGPAQIAALTGGEAAQDLSGWLTLREPIMIGDGSQEVGSVLAAVVPDAVLPFEALETRFGKSGYSVVFDRGTSRVLYHPRHAYSQRTIAELAGPAGWGVDPGIFQAPEGTFTYREADSSRVAFFRSLDSPPWTVMATGSVDEFGAPFASSRAANLALILLLALVVWSAYTLLARRATRSLAVLTDAADRVGAGDLGPVMPPVGQDEVGKLTSAFQLMVGRVRESMRQLEASRQMAAVGSFASQIAHEIRNPLTSLQLNLQGLQRDVEDGRIPPDLARPVDLCLREIHRLNGVVSGVLSLARPHATDPRPCSLHGVIKDALCVLRAQFESAGIEVDARLKSRRDTVAGVAAELKSVFLNIFLNAADAMPDGGAIRIITEPAAGQRDRPNIRVRIEDDGDGIPAAAREDIFKPFFTTKRGGTGIGLSVAAQIVEAHGGSLVLADPPIPARGAVFVIELPLITEEPAL